MVQYHDPTQPGELDPVRYEMLIRAEEIFGVSPDRRGIPTLIVGGQVLVGEDEIREQLRCVIDRCLIDAGTSWPNIPGLENIPVGIEENVGVPVASEGSDACDVDAPVCPVGPSEIWLVYFYQIGCDECDRAWSDIQYVKGKYPQLMVHKLNIFENEGLAICLAKRAGRQIELGVPAPAIFVDKEVLIGPGEITPQTLGLAVQTYTATGTEKFWEDCEGQGTDRVVPEIVAVLLGGLVDGLNPCAFATLIFFISYLTVTERRGKQILAVGGAFAAGVFVTYWAVGIGLYKLVESINTVHSALGYFVSSLMVLFCLVLAVFSVLDFFKARRGEIKDMALVMPERLRSLAHTMIRRTSSVRAFVLVAFLTGAVISFIELACTGQPLLAMIISLVNTPSGSQVYGFILLTLFCVMFIVPLVIVFLLVYFGTTSLQLGIFLKRHTAWVKLATAMLFIVMAAWLAYGSVPWLLGQIRL
jgi:cytochrome c biogenesis protein CcdA